MLSVKLICCSNDDKKIEILDTRFNAYSESGEELKMLLRSSDGQLLFLLNNISKMKADTELGSRIIEVHNGSSLFIGDAGSGESNARRYMLEHDLVEAVIALPENMFYNAGFSSHRTRSDCTLFGLESVGD